MMNDPVGDMLTRIRNGLMRGKSKVSTPASKLRANVLDVLESEGYIRGYSRIDFENGKADIEIELKYFDDAPVIREITRISKPGRRVYSSVKNLASRGQWPWYLHPLHTQGCNGGPRCP